MSNERFVRWQGRTFEQLGYSVNLILGLSVAFLGFALNLIQSTTFDPKGFAQFCFTSSIFSILIAIAFGISCIINRLEDFRITKNIARADEKNPEDLQLAYMRKKSEKLGARTWWLFRAQWRIFGIAIILMSLAYAITFPNKLF